MGRAPCCVKVGLKKGAWSAEEDEKLVAFIQRNNGHGSWRTLPQLAGLLRCGKSCRLRWINYLRPNIKRGNFSPEEESKIIQLHALLGNKWASIATHLPGRTDNDIKNHWSTQLGKRLSKTGIDPATHSPILVVDHWPCNTSPIKSSSDSSLGHMVQWEITRLNAEARLASDGSCGDPIPHKQSARPHTLFQHRSAPQDKKNCTSQRAVHNNYFTLRDWEKALQNLCATSRVKQPLFTATIPDDHNNDDQGIADVLDHLDLDMISCCSTGTCSRLEAVETNPNLTAITHETVHSCSQDINHRDQKGSFHSFSSSALTPPEGVEIDNFMSELPLISPPSCTHDNKDFWSDMLKLVDHVLSP